MIKTLFGFIRKEFRQTLRDPRMRVLLFLAPCLQMILFGVALRTEARNIKLGVYPLSEDTLLHAIYEHAIASTWFVPVDTGSLDPFEAIRSGRADVMLVASKEGLSRVVKKGQGTLQILIDAANVTRAQSIERYLSMIIASQLQGKEQKALSFDVRILYNATLQSAVYMVPGVMSLLMCLATILLTAMAVTREKEVGTFETIIAAPVSGLEVILGKTIPYIILGMGNLPLILTVAVFLFDVPLRGSFLVLLGSSMVFVCATVAIGIMISTIAKTQQQAVMGGFIYLFPSVLLSGLIFPVANMPLPLRLVAYANPLTYFMELLRNIMLKGGDSSLVLRNVLILICMALVFGIISIKRFKTHL